MRVLNDGLLIAQLQNSKAAVSSTKEQKTVDSPSFASVLNEQMELSKLTFSKHASERLLERGIKLSTEQLGRVEMGISKAGEKRITDSLVLVDNVALVVNVQKKHVITAMDKANEKENIFTNINGAVIV